MKHSKTFQQDLEGVLAVWTPLGGRKSGINEEDKLPSQRLECAGCVSSTAWSWVHPCTPWNPQITWIQVCRWQELLCVTQLGAEGSSTMEMLHPKSLPHQESLPMVVLGGLTLSRGTDILRSIPRPSRVQTPGNQLPWEH